MKKIGILGGTFDPIHKGHMQVADQVQSLLSLDEIHFLPCATPVHRDKPQANDKNRIRMIELAIAPNSKYRLNTLEIERGGHSFMIDSLRQIRSQFQSDTIILILGADAFNQFRGWKSPGEILGLVHLVVCRRPGVEPDRSIYADHWVNSRQMLESQSSACILPLEIDENPCSSTLVRELLSQQNQASRCLPAAVYQFIESNHLYEQN